MISDLKSYPAMKDSGVPWLGDVPEHWEVQRGKWLFRSKKKLNSDLRNTNILSLTLRGVVNNDPDNPEGLVPKDYGTYQFFAKDDLVFKLIDLENFRTSRVGLVHEDGIMSPAYVRLVQIHSGIQRYFFQQYFDLYQRGIFNQLGAGVRSTLSAQDLLEVPILSPAVDEQVAIVRFLDHADRRIQRYIRAKQKLIKLLEEQKQVIIHRAVTRGLDPNVRLKSSGVEWLGDVPEHWEVVPSRMLFKHRNEKAGENEEVLTASQTHGIVSRSDFMLREGRRVMQVITGRDILKQVEPNDFVMSMRSFEGGLEWSRIRGAISSAYVMLMPAKDVYPSYYARLLKTRAYISALRRTSDLVRDGQALRYTNFAQIPLPRVPVEEQRTIAAFLDTTVANLEILLQRMQHEIDLLREYHTRLIADVVTGKLDVREAASELPDELEEPDLIDGADEIADMSGDEFDDIEEELQEVVI